MAGLAGLGEFMATDPQMIRGLAMLSGKDPNQALVEAQQLNLNNAKLQEAQRAQQAQEALRAAFAKNKGNITPEMISEIGQYDPELAMKLMEAVRKQNEPDLKFNPVTGDIVDMSGGVPRIVPPQTGVPVSNAAPATGEPLEIPPEYADNPKARQTYIENMAKKSAEMDVVSGGKKKAKESFTNSLIKMRGLVDELDALGGITNTQKSANQNLVTTGLLTGVGQYASRAVGAKQQAQLDKIRNYIPVLMRDIKSATGMSSQEINSIPEMQLLKDSIGDPSTSSYQAVVETLNNIEQKYGVGSTAVAPSRDAIKAELMRRGLIK